MFLAAQASGRYFPDFARLLELFPRPLCYSAEWLYVRFSLLTTHVYASDILDVGNCIVRYLMYYATATLCRWRLCVCLGWIARQDLLLPTMEGKI